MGFGAVLGPQTGAHVDLFSLFSHASTIIHNYNISFAEILAYYIFGCTIFLWELSRISTRFMIYINGGSCFSSCRIVRINYDLWGVCVACLVAFIKRNAFIRSLTLLPCLCLNKESLLPHLPLTSQTAIIIIILNYIPNGHLLHIVICLKRIF